MILVKNLKVSSFPFISFKDVKEKREKNLQYAFQHMVSDMGISGTSNNTSRPSIDESASSRPSQSQSF